MSRKYLILPNVIVLVCAIILFRRAFLSGHITWIGSLVTLSPLLALAYCLLGRMPWYLRYPTALLNAILFFNCGYAFAGTTSLLIKAGSVSGWFVLAVGALLASALGMVFQNAQDRRMLRAAAEYHALRTGHPGAVCPIRIGMDAVDDRRIVWRAYRDVRTECMPACQSLFFSRSEIDRPKTTNKRKTNNFPKGTPMPDRMEDRLDIAFVVNGWMHRDLGEWDKMLELFHPEGIIEVTWFEGLFTDFVAASRKMGASTVRTKHIIGSPSILFDRNKAVVETNAVIVADNTLLDIGASCHNRFFDMMEKRQNGWKIVKRQSIYDMGTFMFPFGPVAIDAETVRRYPREYAPLAYMLEKSGFAVKRLFATKGSELEATMRRDAMKWLEE